MKGEPVKALKVTVDGKVVRVCVPPTGGTFGASLANVPRTYMRAFVRAFNDDEACWWQLPDVHPGQVLSFEMVEVSDGDRGSPPDETKPRDPEEVARLRKQGAEAWAKAKAEMDGRTSDTE